MLLTKLHAGGQQRRSTVEQRDDELQRTLVCLSHIRCRYWCCTHSLQDTSERRGFFSYLSRFFLEGNVEPGAHSNAPPTLSCISHMAVVSHVELRPTPRDSERSNKPLSHQSRNQTADALKERACANCKKTSRTSRSAFCRFSLNRDGRTNRGLLSTRAPLSGREPCAKGSSR